MIEKLYTYAATALVAGAAAAFVSWQVQDWRFSSKIAERDKADATAKIRLAEATIKAKDDAQRDSQASGEYYAKLEQQLRTSKEAERDADARYRAAVKRMLDTSGCSPTTKGVQPDKAGSSTDAVPARWRIERFLPSFDGGGRSSP